MVAVNPSILVILGSVFVSLFLFHDVTHILPSLTTRLQREYIKLLRVQNIVQEDQLLVMVIPWYDGYETATGNEISGVSMKIVST